METPIDIQISSVREVRRLSEVHRWELMLYDGSPVDIEISVDFVRTPEGKLRLQIGAHYTFLRAQVMRPLLDYVIEVNFHIPELDTIADIHDGQMLIDPQALAMMMGIALGALRGMVALRTEGSALGRHPIPIMSIAELITQLAPSPASPSATIRITGSRPTP
ncbi:hypothetical protein [uncultured Duncaniella sp.]|uniref:hypothetical protein n=2 Tax=uncultured Duncaniella sp. TaxID=2768039 RepID=UPI0026E53DCC|nr:hypothetical protein [uncultured Duncaniella sp.]